MEIGTGERVWGGRGGEGFMAQDPDGTIENHFELRLKTFAVQLMFKKHGTQ
jgi:hypothetical protein